MKPAPFYLSLIIFFSFYQLARSQNLVPNADFEINTTTQKLFKCEFEKGAMYGSEYWVLKNYPIDFNKVFSDWSAMISPADGDNGAITKAVRSYANYPLLVKQRKANPNQNKRHQYFAKPNIIKPFSGDCYIKTQNPSVKNLFKIKLKDKTEIGQVYQLSFYYYIDAYEQNHNLFLNGDFGFSLLENDIEAYFVGLNKVVHFREEDLDAYQQMYTIDDTTGALGQWKKHTTVFKADKAYRYLVLGNAKPYTTESISYPWSMDIEYQIINVAIDQVSLQVYVPDFKNYKSGDIFKLENINFATNSSELTEGSYSTLDLLIAYLKTNRYSFEISGHTDNTGSFKENYLLSENRAKSVYDYLIKKGIDESRMSFMGYGSTQPKLNSDANDDLDFVRQMNRRVEIKLY